MYPQMFEIKLDQESRRFIAGQVITGRVVIVLQKEKAVKGISLRFLGKGYVSWECGISGLKYSHNVNSESEIYADIRVDLFSRVLIPADVLLTRFIRFPWDPPKFSTAHLSPSACVISPSVLIPADVLLTRFIRFPWDPPKFSNAHLSPSACVISPSVFIPVDVLLTRFIRFPWDPPKFSFAHLSPSACVISLSVFIPVDVLLTRFIRFPWDPPTFSFAHLSPAACVISLSVFIPVDVLLTRFIRFPWDPPTFSFPHLSPAADVLLTRFIRFPWGLFFHSVQRHLGFLPFHSCSLHDGREQILEPGRHDYCFSVQLPTNIPSTFEGQHGHVRYTLEASIRRSWKEDHTTAMSVQVRGVVDLNAEPKAGESVKIFKEKHVGLMLCHNGPLQVNFILSKAGFVPEEYLQYGVEIRSSANVRISSVIVSLRSHVTYKVGSEKKSQADKVVQCMGPSVEMKGHLLWQNFFQIPDLPPNPFIGCKLMELQYYLELKLVLERWSDLKICTPIVIGTVPYSVPETKPLDGIQHQLFSMPQQIEMGRSNCDGAESNIPPESAPLITAVENPGYTLPCIDWGSSACLAELDKISSRPVQTVPSFLLSASENLYAMSMGSCDKLSMNYEILDDRHILFEDDDAFEICSAQLQNLFLRDDNATKDFL